MPILRCGCEIMPNKNIKNKLLKGAKLKILEFNTNNISIADIPIVTIPIVFHDKTGITLNGGLGEEYYKTFVDTLNIYYAGQDVTRNTTDQTYLAEHDLLANLNS